MNRIITLAFGLFFILTQASAQGKLDYDHDSRWFWGLNVGTTWQTTDVKNKNNFGLGLTLGKTFNYNYGKKVSFDIRGRYLYGNWYGQDVDTTGFERANAALSTGMTNYRDSLGYVVNNFKTEAHRLALELVIHANGIRERTGWDPYIFGGVGLTWHQTLGNQLNSDDSTGAAMYAYDQLNGDYSKSKLNSIQDGSYETALDGTDKGTFNVGFMPSLGIGLGYQVGPRFSLGIEHKTTFTRIDNFDGYNNPTSKISKNDLYHYTSFYLRFQIKRHKVETDPYTDPNSLHNLPNYDDQTNAGNQPPVVTFTNPSVSGTNVSQPNFTIRADVKYVDARENITFKQNGIYNANFTYNATTDKLESNVVLNPGQNVFEITGTNIYGSDQKTTIVIYNRETQTPPIVTFTNPAASPHTTTTQTFNLMATVLNVQQASQITMTVNGQAFPNFSFNPSNSGVTATLNLNLGTNIVTVTGTNAAGTDSETTTIIYRPGNTEQPPVVYFVDPSTSPYTAATSTFLINADVLNVAGSQNITFKQNGSINQNFTFNASTHDFQSSVVLNPGQNVFEIIGTNTAGTAQATTIIIYERKAPQPPIVTITNPSVNPYTTENNVFVLNSTVLNVTAASQIQVTLNGQNLPNFTYVNATNAVSAYLNLIEGTNTVTVRGTNNDGTDIKQTTIIYRKPVMQQPPVVTFTAPSSDPYTTDAATYNVSASVLNVAASSGINVNINGVNISGFNFNPATTSLTFPVNLIEGANVIVITGTNAVGSDTKSHTIIYRKPQTVIPPIVTFQDPISNPQIVFNQSYNVRARVQYVNSAQNILLKINGIASTNFVYSNSSEIMTFTTSLVVGANIIEITGTNSAGQDVATTTIVFRLPDPMLPPTVTITNPANNPSISSVPTAPITATVLNVEGPQNIQVLLNGAVYNGFSYNTASKQLTFTMSLNEGSNNLQITATNNAGQATDARVINYRKVIVQNPPFVTFVNPAVAGTTVSTPAFAVKANVTNVDNISQILVQQNGQTVNPSTYTFNAATKEVLFNTSLNAGNNTFVITGTNPAGTHSASTTIAYRQPVTVCDKPVVSFITPSAQQTEVTASDYGFRVKIENITAANQVRVLVNGVVQAIGDYNAAMKIYAQNITLTVGQNIIEVIATNSCGEVKINRTVIYKPAAAPCLSPVVQRSLPATETSGTELTSGQIKASVINVASASEIVLKVNGANKTFTFDVATMQVSADVPLNLGFNTIELQVSNDCGSSSTSWVINRRACQVPVITTLSTTTANNGTTYAQAFGFKGSITGLTEGSTITVTQNGKQINFVYNQVTNGFILDRPIEMGSTAFVITATNACGTATVTHTVVRRNDPNAVPPVISITNPATSPLNTEEGAMNIQLSTQHVTAANQVAITVNGVATNFNFNASNGTISFNQTFAEGSNVITATAVTQYGTASDTKTVNYKKQVVVKAPQIFITNPANCPGTFPAGTSVITGYVTNISNLSEVTFTMNGRPIGNVNPVLNNGNLTFSITINLGEGSNPVNLQINAATAGGSDSKSCTITVQPASTPQITIPNKKPVVNPTTPTTPTIPTTPTTPVQRKPGIVTPPTGRGGQ